MPGGAVKSLAVEQGAHDLAQVAIRFHKALGDRLYQRLRRLVADEAAAQLASDKARRGRMPHQHVDGLKPFLYAATCRERHPQKGLFAVVVNIGFPAKVVVVVRQRPAGENARQGHHVVLGVAAIHTQGVQFHQLTRVIFVGMILVADDLIQVSQHGRALGAGQHQIPEAPQSVAADDIAVIDQLHHQIIRRGDVEVICPEFHHPFVKLAFAVGSAEDARPQEGIVDDAVFVR